MTIERISLRLKPHRMDSDDGYGAELKMQIGWNDNNGYLEYDLSVNELRDLRYMIDALTRGIEK
jgi:ABC-type nitrate/sulfonate/bicarbonate transport system substrate-binding protein